MTPKTITDGQIRALSKLTWEFQTSKVLHSDKKTYFKMIYGKHFREKTLTKPLCEVKRLSMRYVGKYTFCIYGFRLTEAGQDFLKSADKSKFATTY